MYASGSLAWRNEERLLGSTAGRPGRGLPADNGRRKSEEKASWEPQVICLCWAGTGLGSRTVLEGPENVSVLAVWFTAPALGSRW